MIFELFCKNRGYVVTIGKKTNNDKQMQTKTKKGVDQHNPEKGRGEKSERI